MDQIRVLLWAALLTMLWLGFSQWTDDYGPVPPPPSVAEELPPVEDSPLPSPTPPTGVAPGQDLPQAPDQAPAAEVVGNAQLGGSGTNAVSVTVILDIESWTERVCFGMGALVDALLS